MNKRKKRRRKINPKISNEKQFFIFSEWETELCYFNQLKWFLRKKELKVLWNKGQIPRNNLNKIILLKKSIYCTIKDTINFSKKDIESTKSIICYMLDIDWFNRNSYTQENINFIKKNFEDNNFKVFFSNKDFELWIFLHSEEYKKEDWKYIERISVLIWKDYKKWNCNIDLFRKIIKENLEAAIENWKKLEKYQEERNLNIKDKNPYTEVYKVIEELLK